MTGECHDKVSGIQKIYKDKINETDIVISSLPGAVIWALNFSPDRNFIIIIIRQITAIWGYPVDDINGSTKMESIIGQNDFGWIILDARRCIGCLGNCSNNIYIIDGKQVDLIDVIDGFSIYKIATERLCNGIYTMTDYGWYGREVRHNVSTIWMPAEAYCFCLLN